MGKIRENAKVVRKLIFTMPLSDNIYNCNYRWEKKRQKLEGIMFRRNQNWKRSMIELHIAHYKEHFNLYKRQTSSPDEFLCI